MGLRPALRLSVISTDGFSLGSGTANDGKVTFESILESDGYSQAVDLLNKIVSANGD